ncbi:Fur family transcriptional regulator [Abyssisolibacter fermentans]|uniref:Fur family transcriptional regulator n=1 Tax=Abyssisolibacter fermentans TaxID=1766203 RepID=UPI000829731F|nr:Fur family transcriptional regulator [Abyssisolibacter fermentans]
MNINNDIKEIFKEIGIKYTKNRENIYSFLLRENRPIDAKYLFFKLNEEQGNIDLSTIYRSLEVFVTKGLITKFYSNLEQKNIYEIKQKGHKHYLICTKCKKIKPIDYCPLKEYEQYLSEDTNYVITSHNLVIYGICPRCQNN